MWGDSRSTPVHEPRDMVALPVKSVEALTSSSRANGPNSPLAHALASKHDANKFQHPADGVHFAAPTRPALS